MAEDPKSWGPLEHAIDEALREARNAYDQKVIGLSTVRRIADNLREVRGFILTDDLRAAIERGVDAPWDKDDPTPTRDQMVNAIMSEIGGTHAVPNPDNTRR